MAKHRFEKRAPAADVSVVTPATPPPPDPWKKPVGLSRRGVWVLITLLLLVNVPVLHHFLHGGMETRVSVPFADEFSSQGGLSERYFSTGGDWRVRDGFLISPGVHNNALWLKAALPDDVRITFDARAVVAEGDIRIEVFGNGADTLSGYRLVLSPSGSGSRAILYRLGDNGPLWSELSMRAGSAGPLGSGLYGKRTAVRAETAFVAIRTNEAQHWTLERRGQTLRWAINEQLVMDFTDPLPLHGRGNDRFGFSSSEFDVLYDRLKVEPASHEPFSALAAPPRPPEESAAPSGSANGFTDRFERDGLGPDWRATDVSSVRVGQGVITLERAHNHPVWLNWLLPENAVIELDAWSESPDGDLKVEAWGDGSSAHEGDLRAAYTASGYVFVMGGWRNTRSTIARREEHGEGVIDRTDVKVEPGRRYHWRITRRAGHLTWEIDGTPFLSLNDPRPLRGPGHEHFALSDWEARVHFDNVVIRAL